MSGPKLPAVRLPVAVYSGDGPDTDGPAADAVVVELPPSSKFGFAWPKDGTLPPVQTSHTILDRVSTLDPSASDTDTDISDSDRSLGARDPAALGEDGHDAQGPDPHAHDTDGSEHTPTNRLHLDDNPLEAPLGLAGPPALPRLSRAFSMPVQSQLGHLKNPRRMPSSTGSFLSDAPPPDSPLAATQSAPDYSSFHELSLELADSVQMVIQTLLQLSPPQVLDPAKEQFSACSLSIPTPSISAMFTSMKNLNYMSANMPAFTSGLPSPPLTSADRRSSIDTDATDTTVTDFDIGELIQSAGDAMGGLAAEAGVDLVLYHGDVGLKHVSVRGDECGISYTITHVSAPRSSYQFHSERRIDLTTNYIDGQAG
jgi:osomolarity two-component system, response regulator SSK1